VEAQQSLWMMRVGFEKVLGPAFLAMLLMLVRIAVCEMLLQVVFGSKCRIV
jgi:hypothetical protein